MSGQWFCIKTWISAACDHFAFFEAYRADISSLHSQKCLLIYRTFMFADMPSSMAWTAGVLRNWLSWRSNRRFFDICLDCSWLTRQEGNKQVLAVASSTIRGKPSKKLSDQWQSNRIEIKQSKQSWYILNKSQQHLTLHTPSSDSNNQDIDWTSTSQCHEPLLFRALSSHGDHGVVVSRFTREWCEEQPWETVLLPGTKGGFRFDGCYPKLSSLDFHGKIRS